MRWSGAMFGIASLLVVVSPAATLAEEIDARDIYPSRPLIKTDKWIFDINPHISSQFSTILDFGQVITDDVFADVGRGYNPITNKIGSVTCVEGTEPDHELGKGTIPRSDISVYDDVNSHQRSSGSSFGFSAIVKAAQIGFGSSEARGQYFNKVEKFARIWARVATVGKERRNVKWNPKAEKWLVNDTEKFLDQCGTHYVRAVFSGHLLDMWVRFTLDEDHLAMADAKAVSIGVPKIFGASIGSSDAEAGVSQHSTASLKSHGLGAFALPPASGTLPASGGGAGASASAQAGTTAPGQSAPKPGEAAPAPAPAAPPIAPTPAPAAAVSPTTANSQIQVLLDWYNNGYVKAVEAADKASALPLYILVEDYHSKDNLPHTSRIPYWTLDAMEKVSAKAEIFDNLTTIISDIKWALTEGSTERYSVFYQKDDGQAVDEAYAKDKLKTAEGLFKKLRTAILDCNDLMKSGMENQPDGTATSKACEDKLDASVSDEEVLRARLKRKYN